MSSHSPASSAQKRVSRACLFCRQRKSKCDLDISGGAPPCQRCLKDGRECVLGGSNRWEPPSIRINTANYLLQPTNVEYRGGARVRKKKPPSIDSPSAPASSGSATRQEPLPPFSPPVTKSPPSGMAEKFPERQGDSISGDAHLEDSASTPDSTIGTTIPTNPSDAWQLLRDVAVRNTDGGVGMADLDQRRGSAVITETSRGVTITGIYLYRLVREGHLTPIIVAELVQTFKHHYHAYLPLVPKKYYEPEFLDQFATENKHLLTAVLTIASKDNNNIYIHECCSRYMHDLIASISAGTDCDVEAVEALLLLAEWVPPGLRKSGEAVGRGEEDRTAWMHVGLALRTGYWLGLDRTSFRSEDAEEVDTVSRKRLAWTCCYISDRLISCRIGKAFWSRGPGPMTGLSSNDFPSLIPSGQEEENHARIFKAILDMTQIYSNVHDILYSATRANGQMVLSGDYVKYIDEFRSTISRWHRQWGSLVCSPHIKVTLDLSYQYLRLYTNAFAFQAAISQALAKRAKVGGHAGRDHVRKQFKDIGIMPDARFIFTSIEAAKQYLSIFNGYLDASILRYMPIRFYLYCIYSAVFLYKARSFGALRPVEEPDIGDMINATVNKLKLASSSPQDPGSRYARLLELLWQKSRPAQAPAETGLITQRSPNSITTPQSTGLSETSGPYTINPATGFSWLDLGATADFANAEMMDAGSMNNDLPMGFNFIPQHAQDIGFTTTQQYPYNMPTFDFNGNLPF